MLLKFLFESKIIIKWCPDEEDPYMKVAYEMGCPIEWEGVKGKFLVGENDKGIIPLKEYRKNK